MRSGQVRNRAPRSAASPSTTAADGGLELALGQGPLVVAQDQPVGQALVGLGQRPAAVDVEQASRRAGAGRRGGGSPPPPRPPAGPGRRSPPGRARPTGVATARRRAASTAAPPASPAIASSATRIRSARRSSAAIVAGWTSPTRPTSDPPARTRAARPGMQVRIVGRGARRRAPGSRAGRQIGLDDALRVVEVVGGRRSVPGGRDGGAGQRETESPPLVRRPTRRSPRSPCRPRRSRRRRWPCAEVRRDDLEQAADEALAQHRMLARQRVRDRDRPAARALLRLAVERPVVVGRERARPSGARPGRSVTTSVRPAPDERLADGVAGRERVVPVGRHRRVRQDRRDELVAVDPDDLLGDVGLDREVAPPGRHGRLEDRVGPPGRRRAASSRPRPRTRVPAGAALGLDADPGEQRPLLARWPSAVPSSRLTRAGRNATRAGAGSTGFESTAPGAIAPPAQSAIRRAVRSAPSRASRNSWPFSKRRLASERSA